MNRPNELPTHTEFLLYQTADGRVRIETRLHDETIWLSLNQLTMLFGVDKSGVSRHLKNIFATGELVREAVVAKFATTAADGKTYQVDHYNLDAIISVGYRVNTIRGTHFRIWATERLKEYIIKGFALNTRRGQYIPRFAQTPPGWEKIGAEAPPQRDIFSRRCPFGSSPIVDEVERSTKATLKGAHHAVCMSGVSRRSKIGGAAGSGGRGDDGRVFHV